jgi:hypothetical protein
MNNSAFARPVSGYSSVDSCCDVVSEYHSVPSGYVILARQTNSCAVSLVNAGKIGWPEHTCCRNTSGLNGQISSCDPGLERK